MHVAAFFGELQHIENINLLYFSINGQYWFCQTRSHMLSPPFMEQFDKSVCASINIIFRHYNLLIYWHLT